MRPNRATVIFLLCSVMVLGFVWLNNRKGEAPSTPGGLKPPQAIQAVPLKLRNRPHHTLFEKLSPESSGIDMVHPLDITHPMKRLYDSGFAAGAVALGDIDSDRRLDIFFSSGPLTNRLYRQLESVDGEIRFEDISEKAKIGGGDLWASGAVMVDIEGDGDLDIYVCYYDSPNQLYVNDGSGSFSEQASKYGLVFGMPVCSRPLQTTIMMATLTAIC